MADWNDIPAGAVVCEFHRCYWESSQHVPTAECIRGTKSSLNSRPVVAFESNRRFGKSEAMRQAAEVLGVALENSKVVGATIDGKPIHEVEVALNGPKADLEAARRRVEGKLGWNPGGLDDCSIDSISPDNGDVLIIQYPSAQDHAVLIEAIRTAISHVNLPVPCIVIPDEMIVESWTVAELRALRDRLNEVIYDKERHVAG